MDEIKIRIEAELGKVKKLAEKFRLLATLTKEADYAFRQGKISSTDLAYTLSVLQNKADALGGTLKQHVDINANLYQVQQRAATGFKSLNGTLTDMHATLKANAVPSVLEFSRIIQDAPFGIRGVANNVQQLATNFVYLKDQAGGTVPAIKAMLSAMTGGMGVMLAISLISSLAVAFGDKLFPSVKKTKEEMFDLRTETTKLVEELNKIGELGEKEKVKYYKSRISEIELALGYHREFQGFLFNATGVNKSNNPNINKELSPEEQTKLVKELIYLRGELLKIEKASTKEAKEKQKETDYDKWQWDMVEADDKRTAGKEKAIDARHKNEERRRKKESDDAEQEERAEIIRQKKREKAELDRIKHIYQQNEWLISSLGSGVRGVGQEIDRFIYDEFSKAFNGANSLFEIFLVNVLSGLAEIATQLAMLQLVSWFLPSFGGIGSVFEALGGGGGLINSNTGKSTNVPFEGYGMPTARLGISPSASGNIALAREMSALNMTVSRLSTKNGDQVLVMTEDAKRSRYRGGFV